MKRVLSIPLAGIAAATSILLAMPLYAPAYTFDASDQAALGGGTSGVKIRIVNSGAAYGADSTAMDAAEAALAAGSLTGNAYGLAATVNYDNGGNSWPTGTNGDNFALQATGFLVIPTAGDYTFCVNSDDGFRLRLGNNLTTVLEYPSPRGPTDSLGAVTFSAAGVYAYQLSYYENGGGQNVQLYAQAGNVSTRDSSMKLVGDTANGGLKSYANSAFLVRSVKAADGYTINSVAAAESLLDGTTPSSRTVTGSYAVINFNDGSDSIAVHYGSTSKAFPLGQTLEQYVVQATAKVWIPDAGTYTFGANTDDGCKLVVNGSTIFSVGDRGAADSFGTYTFNSAGFYDLAFLMYEDGGNSNMQLFAAKGEYTSFDSSAFRLVGDVANGGLTVVPEPNALALLTAGLFGLLAYAWRKRK